MGNISAAPTNIIDFDAPTDAAEVVRVADTKPEKWLIARDSRVVVCDTEASVCPRLTRLKPLIISKWSRMGIWIQRSLQRNVLHGRRICTFFVEYRFR